MADTSNDSLNDTMAAVYANLIQKGLKTIKQVPKALQAEVKKILAGGT